jgi:hypothetical protein
MIKGYAKFDSLAVGEFSASFLGTNLKLECKAAFVDSKTGQTHGWTANQTWSPPVIAKLKELRELMEMDLGAIHLEGGGETVPNTVTPQRSAQAPTGLGEHVNEGGIEQA